MGEERPNQGEAGAAEVFTLPEGEVNASAIMAEVERRAERLRREGLFRDLPVEELDRERAGAGETVISFEPLHELIFISQLAKQYARVDTYYPIGARRSPLGPIILLAKKVLRRFMTPYMDAVFAKQREFNAQVVKSLDVFLELIKRERDRSYKGGVDRYTAWEELGLAEDGRELYPEVLSAFPPGAEIVHLQCGRGEFLQRAAEEGREALGVEEDSRLVRICQEKGLRVLHSSPLDFLESQRPRSLEAVFMQEAGERGDARELLFTVNTLAQVMEEGGVAAMLNHCPRSILGTEEAFRDPTVVRLLHPETVAGLLRRAGFREVEVRFLGVPTEEEKEAWLAATGEKDSREAGDLAGLVQAPRRYLLEARR